MDQRSAHSLKKNLVSSKFYSNRSYAVPRDGSEKVEDLMSIKFRLTDRNDQNDFSRK